MRYVIAYSPYEVQDVTWRYTCKHLTTRSRRTLCDERLLLDKIMKLRAKRQEHLPKYINYQKNLSNYYFLKGHKYTFLELLEAVLSL